MPIAISRDIYSISKLDICVRVCLYLYALFCICMHLHALYIYIYIVYFLGRERERERKRCIRMHLSSQQSSYPCIHMHAYPKFESRHV